MAHWTESLERIKPKPCQGAIEWAASYPTLQAAWDACERGDWMLWWLGKCLVVEVGSPDHKKLVSIASANAKLALLYAEDGPPQPEHPTSISVVEAWLKGEATLAEVGDATRAAQGHSWNAYEAAFWPAIRATWAAINAATRPPWAAAEAVGAVWAAAEAAIKAAERVRIDVGAFWAAAQKECAAIVRQHYPVASTVEVSDDCKGR